MINIQELSFSYKKEEPLFRRLNLSLPMGNIYGLLGKNGAGKSTLLKIISGLLFPDQGSLDVVGYRPWSRYPQFLQEIYLVSEEFHVPNLKMERYVRLYSPFYPRFNYGIFEEYIKEFDLPANRKLNSLSYGQKKKFLLSFGLATESKLLILDEPTNGLDIPSKSQFRKIIASAIHEDRSFIISTHQARDMENLIDPIIILDQGEVIFSQSFEEIARRITISKQKELPPEEELIYAESTFGGYTVVKKNQGKEEVNLNLEILFNAVVNAKDKVSQIFEEGGSDE